MRYQQHDGSNASTSMSPPSGQGGIRTHGTREGPPVFKTGAFNRSATCPNARAITVADRARVKKIAPRASRRHRQPRRTLSCLIVHPSPQVANALETRTCRARSS